MIFQLTLFRFITVYIVQSFMLLFYVVISYRLLRKREEISRKRLLFSIYYLCSIIGITLNYIYAPIQHDILTSVLYLFTIYIIYVGTNFLAIFSIAMYYEIKDNLDTTKIQITYIIAYSSLYLVLFFIPEGIRINEKTGWYPVVKFPFLVYCTILVNISLIIIIIFSIKTLKIFKERNENLILNNRWKLYIIGMAATIVHASIVMMVHFINSKPIRDIWSIIGGILLAMGIYLTWFGIGKKFL